MGSSLTLIDRTVCRYMINISVFKDKDIFGYYRKLQTGKFTLSMLELFITAVVLDIQIVIEGVNTIYISAESQERNDTDFVILYCGPQNFKLLEFYEEQTDKNIVYWDIMP